MEQLNDHDYVSNPHVYDADEEYVASLLYSLASLQLSDPITDSSLPQDRNQSDKIASSIKSFLTYPSPSYKGKVIIAALYTQSVFEMHHRFDVSSIYTKYLDTSYSVPIRCEAYRCLTRVLLRNEESPIVWAHNFSWIFNRALSDPHPSVVVAFLHYLINPETMSPFIPITEFYLNTTRKNQPSLPVFNEESSEGAIFVDQIWDALGSPSRYNPQLRKLLFILYKQLFGIDVPKVCGNKPSTLSIIRLNFDGTPLELYPAMVLNIIILHFQVNTIYIDKGKETPIIERERKTGNSRFCFLMHRFPYV